MAENKLLTQKEFGKMIGTSQQYVSKLVKKGVIKLKDKRIDPDQAKSAMKIASEPTRSSAVNNLQRKGSTESGLPTTSHHQSLVKSRAIKEHYKAGLAKLEYEHKADNMVDRVEYDAALLKALAARDIVLKNYILSIPARCAIKWPNPATRAQLKEIVDTEVREILSEMSKPNLAAIRREMKRGNAD